MFRTSCRFARLGVRSPIAITGQCTRSLNSLSVSTRKPLYSIQSYKNTSALRVFTQRGFSTTVPRLRPSGTDEELIAKLESELSYEEQIDTSEELPSNIKEFMNAGIFTVNDKLGLEEVELVRTFGEETIRVMFSVSDVDNMEKQLDDEAMYDEEPVDEVPEEVQEAPKKGTSRSGNAPQSASAPSAEEDQENYEDPDPAYPVRLNITVEKPNQGALQFEAIAQDGMIIVENVHYHKSAQLATAQSAEADYERRGNYVGPPFGNLDEELQAHFEKYLDEREINTTLAIFIPDYIDYKEQKEYCAWLKNVKKFIES